MSALWDSLQEIFYTLSQNKLRTFLTAFGVFWGIFMLILLLGAGKGLQNGIMSNFGTDASDSVWIHARKTSVPYMGMGAGRSLYFTSADVQAIQDLPAVLIATSSKKITSTVKYERVSQSYQITGAGDGFFDIKIGLEVRNGRKLHPLDTSEYRKVAIIGSVVAKSLFGDSNPVNKRITINNMGFLVIGVFYDSGENGRSSERIYIPLSLFQKTLGRGQDRVGTITYIPTIGADPFKTEDEVLGLLRQRLGISPEDRSALRANNRVKQSQWVHALFAAINALIWFVGLGTLAAGIVGISNIMMITVKERTMEIGVRKALGATPLSIITALLFESVLVTSIAGYLGLALSVGLLEGINNLLHKFAVKLPYFQNPEINFSVAIVSVLLLIAAGTLAGFAPAWRAARIAPVEAMRS